MGKLALTENVKNLGCIGMFCECGYHFCSFGTVELRPNVFEFSSAILLMQVLAESPG